MKKLACAATALLLGLCLAACAGVLPAAELVLIPGAGGVDDRSFNESAWSAMRVYSGLHGVTCNYVEPASQTDAARMQAVKGAVGSGAKLVVLPGDEFAAFAPTAAAAYPKTSFLFLDTGGTQTPPPNAARIGFAGEEAGYLAGYAAVADGYTKLGFLGGAPVEGVVNYGFGFAAGANDAAKAYGKPVEMKYAYADSFEESKAAQRLAAEWYQGGTELIFAAAGGLGESVFQAAEETGGKTIGVDGDQSMDSPTVVTSALKGIGEAVGQTLDAYATGSFPAGEALRFGAAEGAVGLAMDTARFRQFTQDEYTALRNRVAAGEVDIPRFEGAPEGETDPNETNPAGIAPDATKLDKIPGFEYLGVLRLA